MITLTMNREEMFHNLTKAYNSMRPYILIQRNLKVVKFKNAFKKQSYSLTVPFTYDNQKFYYIEQTLPNLAFWMFIVCEIESDKQRTFAVVSRFTDKNFSERGPLFLMSEHLLKRYSERLDIPFKFPDIIKRYLVETYTFICVYHNDEKGQEVWATKKGIILATYNKEDEIFTCRTFVSKAMMKGTQLDAHEKVLPLLEKCEKDRRLSHLTGVEAYKSAYNSILASELAHRLSQNIYQQYFTNFQSEL